METSAELDARMALEKEEEEGHDDDEETALDKWTLEVEISQKSHCVTV